MLMGMSNRFFAKNSLYSVSFTIDSILSILEIWEVSSQADWSVVRSMYHVHLAAAHDDATNEALLGVLQLTG